MEAQELVREFKYNSVTLADPNPAFTLPQVRDFFATVYPEIVNADIEGPDVKGNRQVFTFRRAVGTKGGYTPVQMISDLGTLMQAGWLEPHEAEFVKELQERVQGDTINLDADDSLRLMMIHRKRCGRVIDLASKLIDEVKIRRAA